MAEQENPKGGEQVILSVNLDTSGAEAQGAELATGLNNSLQKVGEGMGQQSLKSYKTLIREATNEATRLAASVGLQDKAYVAAAKKLAGLKDEFQEFNASV